MSDQTPQQPGWGPPPEPQPPKPKRQFLVTKIAIGVAAGIALFLVGTIVLIAILIGGSSTGDKQATATAAAPVTTEFAPPDSTPVDETPTTQAPEVASVGDTVSATADDGSGADITVTKVSTATVDRGTIAPNDSSFWDHPTHGLYLIVRMTVKGTGSAGYDVNTADFSVVAPDGQTYDEQTESDTWGQSIPLATVRQGNVKRGVIVFDVSKQARHGEIAYDPNASGDPIATWKY